MLWGSIAFKSMNATPPMPLPAPKRRWLPRFGLRTLLVVMGALGIGLAYFGNLLRRAQHQRRVVAKIEAAGGKAIYNYEFGMAESLNYASGPDNSIWIYGTSDGRNYRNRQDSEGMIVEKQVETPPGPWFIRRVLGDDTFAYVEGVNFWGEFDSPGKVDPRVLLELPRLKVVAPFASQVNDEWLHCIAQVPQLRCLNLAGGTQGTATRDGLASLRTAKQLEALGLSGEWLQDETVTGVAHLRQLKSLSFAAVPNVSSALFSNLDELTELRELSIIRAKSIDDQGSDRLRRLHNLRTLWLLDTSISDATLAHVKGLTQLEWLQLDGTNVGDPGMEFVAALPKLKHLHLGRTNVGDAGVESLSGLSQLRNLDLGGTKITDAGLSAIARLAQLEQLELWPTSITDSGLQHLHSLNNLKELTIGPHVTQEGADELRKALPQCKVRRVDASGSGLD